MAHDFRCDYCGQFISYADLDAGKAECYMLTPDSEFTTETYATHHMACKQADEEDREARYAAMERRHEEKLLNE